LKARTVTVKFALGAVVATEVLGLAAHAMLPPDRFGWSPLAVTTLVAGVLLVVRVHRHNLATWLAARMRWRRQRRRATAVGAAVDISHGGAVYGVRTADHEAVTVIEVDGRAYSPTFLRGSSLALTDNVLPLRVLTELMEQPGGLLLGIDVVSDGYRVRPGTGYPQLYVTLLADRGAAGQRTTYLVVRLDITDSVQGLVYRRSIGSAAAAATERIVKELEQVGVRARALGAEEHDTVLATLSLGLVTPPTRPVTVDDAAAVDEDLNVDPVAELVTAGARHRRDDTPARRLPTASEQPRVRPKSDVGWNTINTSTGFVTSYYFSADDITTDSFNQMWALPSDHIVHVLAMRKRRGGPVTVRALVRTTEPSRPDQPPTLYLNTLPGDQYAAAVRAAPTSQPRLKLPSRVLDPAEDLRIPIGPTGILIGAALRDDTSGQPKIQRDDLVMLALTDPQRPTRIVMDTSEFYVRQLMIRAAAAGERIAIYSRDPQRWYSVSQPNIAVVQPRRPAEFVPTIIVNDRPHLAPSAGLSSTVITLGTAGGDTAAPDLRFEQTSQSTVRITTATRSNPLDVAMVVFRQEQTWTG
jgi:type VII secretion protein EccE